MQVRINKLEVNYQSFKLRVDNLTFEAKKISTLIGPNGAGKTTLLKSLAGLLPLSPGSIFMNGQDLSKLKGSKKASLVSYVPQEQAVALNHTVFDFILMGRSGYLNIFSRPAANDYRKTEEIISYLGLEEFAFRKCSELSSGERRIVLIGRALAQDSTIILLDEPTTFLDLRHEMEVINLLKKLVEEKDKTIITSMHSVDLIPRLADFIVLLKQGRILASGQTKEIFKTELLEELFDYPVRVVEAEGNFLLLR